MTITKKNMALILASLTLLISCLITVSCSQEEPEDPKSDILLKIACWRKENDKEDEIVEEWIFPLDVDEMRVTREYDGNKYRVSIYQVQYVNNSPFDGKWIKTVSGALAIGTSLKKRKETPEQYGYGVAYVCDKGEYEYIAYTYNNDNMNNRTVRLYITVE